LAWKEGAAAEALELINRAFDVVGPIPSVLDTRALVSLKMGKGEPAVKDLKEAVAEAPTAPRYVHLARAYLLAGHRPSALAALRTAETLGLKADSLEPRERAAYHQLLAALNRR
jgi:tetratricopeptide (TPR) repeat protein